jgi:hypothetical protein
LWPRGEMEQPGSEFRHAVNKCGAQDYERNGDWEKGSNLGSMLG